MPLARTILVPAEGGMFHEGTLRYEVLEHRLVYKELALAMEFVDPWCAGRWWVGRERLAGWHLTLWVIGVVYV